jgi:hypothetical protein
MLHHILNYAPRPKLAPSGRHTALHQIAGPATILIPKLRTECEGTLSMMLHLLTLGAAQKRTVMQRRDIEGVIKGVLPTTSRTSVTLTGVAAERAQIVLKTAIDYCRANDAPLSEVHLPSHLIANVRPRFDDLTFADSGADDVFRLVFQP